MKVNPLTYSFAVNQIEQWLKEKTSRFVSIAAVNNIVCALRDPQLMQIENTADMVTTDGMPLVWILKSRGHKDCERVYGPTLMLKILKMAEREQFPSFFYGCTDEILVTLTNNLKSQFPKLRVAGTFAPPYRTLSEEENNRIVDHINLSGARLVWVGLSTPKQEQWMYYNKNKIKNCVLLGVGAAFLFHAGKVKQAPAILQKLGLEWLFRLTMEPRRLWRRYIWGNFYFIWKLILSKEFFVKTL